MKKKSSVITVVALGLCLFASLKASSSFEPMTATRVENKPEGYVLQNEPYLLLRVYPNEAKAWLQAKDALASMVVIGGNVLDNPKGFPQGYGVIGYREGDNLAFLVEGKNGWEMAKEGYRPKEKEAFYLCLWQSTKNRGGN